MNIWTHLIGTILFVFLIYLTYAIPVDNIFTLRPDVTKATAISECKSWNLTDIVGDETVNATCVETRSRDENNVQQFSNLFYYLSSTSHAPYVAKVENESSSIFTWFGNTLNQTLTTDTVKSMISSLQTLYTNLMSSIQAGNFFDNIYLSKSVEVAEVLEDDLHEMNHKVIGHVPRWPIIVFICCAIWCLGGSTIYHHYYCCGFLISNILQTLDYCGICILISGSYVPVIYYSFYCYPTPLRVHLTIVIIINVINVCVMATPKFRQPEYRPVRAKSFTIVACYAVISLIHLIILDGFDNPIFSVMFWYVVGMGSTYILGAYLYGSRFPEKYWPGYFDYVVSESGWIESSSLLINCSMSVLSLLRFSTSWDVTSSLSTGLTHLAVVRLFVQQK